MEAAAAVAEEQAAGGIGEESAERIDAIGQRHAIPSSLSTAAAMEEAGGRTWYI